MQLLPPLSPQLPECRPGHQSLPRWELVRKHRQLLTASTHHHTRGNRRIFTCVIFCLPAYMYFMWCQRRGGQMPWIWSYGWM